MLLESLKITKTESNTIRSPTEERIKSHQLKIILFLLICIQIVHNLKQSESDRIEIERKNLKIKIEQKIEQMLDFIWNNQEVNNCFDYPKLEEELLLLVKNYKDLGGGLEDLKNCTKTLPESVQFNIYYENLQVFNLYQ